MTVELIGYFAIGYFGVEIINFIIEVILKKLKNKLEKKLKKQKYLIMRKLYYFDEFRSACQYLKLSDDVDKVCYHPDSEDPEICACTWCPLGHPADNEHFVEFGEDPETMAEGTWLVVSSEDE